MIKAILLLLLIFSFLIVIFSLYQPFIIVKIVQKLFSNLIFYVPTEKDIYSLTFDDGPNPPYTDEVLDILDAYSAKATFFLIGKNIKKYPEYIDNIRFRGHQIGNHSFEDKPTILLTKNEFIKSLDDTEALIKQDPNSKIFRPSSGWIKPSLLNITKERQYKVIIGSAYVSDSRNPSKFYMLKALKSMLRPNIIIALHDGGEDRSKTVEILPEILEYAKKKNLKAVTINDLLKEEIHKT